MSEPSFNSVVEMFQHRVDSTPDAEAMSGRKDGKWHSAQAEIRGDKVVVWNPQVKDPVAVRYDWANYPTGNLWNRAGLPASPFRTDDFPLTTAPR